MEFYKSDWFQVIGVTIISSGIGIFLKFVSRNDTHSKTFKKEDLAIGLDLMITALILLITNSVNHYNILSGQSSKSQIFNEIKQNLDALPWVLFIFVIGLWGTSTVVRKAGWENEDELKIWWGIVFPNIIGVAYLIYVFTWIKL